MKLQHAPVAAALLALGSAVSTAAQAAPTISWSAPSAGATMYGAYSNSTACQVTTSGANRVKFYVDSQEVNSDNTAPYQCAFDTRKFKTGTHTLRATAIASDGSTASVTRSVNFGTSTTSTTSTSTSTTSTSTTSTTTTSTTTSTPPPTSGSLDVWFKAPKSGNTVTGVLGGTSCYVAGTGVARVAFSVDGKALNTDTTMSDGMQCALDTRTLSNGTHTLTATAYSSTGAARSDVISINVQNTVVQPANTAPAVSFTSPAAGTVSGTVSYAAIASDDKAVTRVVFKLDGTTIADKTAAPWSGSIDTKTLSNASHTLTATAYDAEGLNRTATVALTVNNTVATPTTPPTSGTSTPPPTSGALDIWFKAPKSGNTVSGVLSGTGCYTAGSGIARVDFSVDGTALNADTTMADGMQCVLDTTKLANGTHTLTAKATSATGATRSDVISINVQNAATTPPPTTTPTEPTTPTPTAPPPSAGGLPADSAGVRAVPTFHNVGLYWTSPGATSATGCKVQFRKQGETTWKDALDMWFDSRNSECRGSIVKVDPATVYEVQMGLPGQSFNKGLTVKTWSEQFPIAQTITLPAGTVTQPLIITQGGTASGYILYQANPAGTTIDVQNAYDNNVTVSAPYVIVRGITMKNARIHGVDLRAGSHDVVIENNDISGWGRYMTTSSNATTLNGWAIGVDMDSAVMARCPSAGDMSRERYIVQRNKIHDPRYGAGSWDWGHPMGPQGITFSYCGGNHVLRYNEITSSDYRHYYNDGIGGEDNFTATGFPVADTDIYGNVIQGVMDDAIEAEGGNKNVRIYGNYMDQTGTGIASTATHWGPLYIFNNVYNRSRKRYANSLDTDDRGPFFKSGNGGGFGSGRRYVFHNTALQAPGATYGLGAGTGLQGQTGQPLVNTVSRNNILHIWKPNWQSIEQTSTGYGNDANFDLFNGVVNAGSPSESNGIKLLNGQAPQYQAGHGAANGAGGNYQLAPGTPGSGAAQRLPNFNDAFAAPDMGAHQAGTPAMKFGVNQ